MDTRPLEEIGLTKNEIKVYLTLIELGSSTKGPIVDKSGVASSKIYELLDKLEQKGLVSEVIKSNVRHFEAAPTTRILDYVKEKEQKIDQQKIQLEKILPQLELKRLAKAEGSETQVFKGIKGAITSFDDILHEMKANEEYYVLGISEFTNKFEDFIVKFHHKRAFQKIKCKVILNARAKEIGTRLEKVKLTTIKYVPEEIFTPVVFIIYKDKTLISIGLDEIFIQIKSAHLSEGLKSYFSYMWKIGKTK